MEEAIKILQGKLSRAYESIQNLAMQPTKTNMEIVLGTMAALKDAYDFLGTLNPKQEEPEKAQADAIDDGKPEKEEGHV